ncbi:hypothetical protein GOP47_0020673 [Adiantum capillus-veneris]|uniref:Pectinesterase n=1 Tax=Adiantum capillus-veneris TaxID=13818 RepID=A0A9D4U9L8_ADICA|nr:hypothetical protein GOP47_0020673 [Adiantum capillus-veneris]
MRSRALLHLLAVAAAAVSAALLIASSPASAFDGLEDMRQWCDRVEKKTPVYADEDPDDDDHMPSRPTSYDDNQFSKKVKGLYKHKKGRSYGKPRRPGRKLDEVLNALTLTNAAAKKASADPPIIVVAKDGTGHVSTVQAAVNRIPKGNKKRVVIFVKKGIYREKVRIPKTKPFITLKGEGAALTYIQWGDTASTKGPDGKNLSTYGSASVAVESDDFIALDIAFKNTAPAPQGGEFGKQAVALRIQGDRAAFYRCSFFGAQDTLYDRAGRHYYYKCYIEGSIDFIFGNARSLFVKCHMHSIATPFGSISAHKRMEPSENTGYSFVYSVVTGSGTIYLGRAWGPYSRVIYAYTYFDNIITPQGWNDFGLPANQKKVFYGEYKCFGPGADRTGRVAWSYKLTSKQARPFLSLGFIDGKEWVSKQ